MASKNETIKDIAIRLSELAYPNHDPREEVELNGVKSELFDVVRTEGTGIGARQIGPRWAAQYREAQKLYVVVELLEERQKQR